MLVDHRLVRGTVAAVLLATWNATPAPAQAPNPLGAVKVTGGVVRSPEVQAKSYTSINPKKADWFQIVCDYDTKPEWTDEITLTFYTLVKTGDPKEPFILLKNEETFVHLARGKHRAHAFLHPSLLRRYGKVEGCAVEVRYQGRPVGADSTDPGYQKWIAQLSPKEGHILMPKDTPFAHLDYDAFEMVKPRSTR
ncbi:MAG: hypothetical protein KJ579_09040 [Verrucomicrobia bacterium]|nr:hypothetical protein [Verrucomicrobiota bacterium]